MDVSGLTRKEAISKFLKIMKLGDYKLLSLFIEKYLENEFDGFKFIDAKVISETLEINRDKSNKLIRLLKDFNVLKTALNSNSYSLVDSNDFEKICIEMIDNHMNIYLKNLNFVFKKNDCGVIYSRLDPLTAIELYNKALIETDLNQNIYSEYSTTCLPANNNWNELKNSERELFGIYYHKDLYNLVNKRFLAFKQRLDATIKNNMSGIVNKILFLRRYFDWYVYLAKMNKVSPEKQKESLILILNRIKESIELFKPFFMENKINLIVDFNCYCFNGPIGIFSPHSFQMLYEGTIENKIYEVYHYYSKNHAENLSEVYIRFFNNLLMDLKIIKSKTYDNILEKNISMRLYDYCLKTIDNKIKEIEHPEFVF